MMEWLHYAVAWAFVKTLGVLPRSVARSLAAGTTRLLLLLMPKLRKTAEVNLRLAFPEWTNAQRRAIPCRAARRCALVHSGEARRNGAPPCRVWRETSEGWPPNLHACRNT